MGGYLTPGRGGEKGPGKWGRNGGGGSNPGVGEVLAGGAGMGWGGVDPIPRGRGEGEGPPAGGAAFPSGPPLPTRCVRPQMATGTCRPQAASTGLSQQK